MKAEELVAGSASIPDHRAKTAIASVAALLQCSNLGGMEQVAYSLFDKLQSRGFSIQVVTPRPWGEGRSRVLRVDPRAQAFGYRGKFGWRSFPQFLRQAQFMARSSACVWVVGTCSSCLRAARLSGKRTLLSHHYHHFENARSRLKWTAFYLAFGPGLDAITYPTHFTRDEALRIAPWLRSKTHVVRNAVDIHYTNEEERLENRRAARASLGIQQEAFVIGNAGWLIKRKRFDVFLETAGRISRQLSNARFYICGGGPEEAKLRSLAREIGIADKVHFQGWVKDMTVYYRAWDAVLFNSDFDAMGLIPMEAASHGCPSVSSCRYGGLSEFVKDGQTGFILNRHDTESLAASIVRLAREPSLALRIRHQARETIKNEFSHKSALAFYENYFRLGSAPATFYTR